MKNTILLLVFTLFIAIGFPAIMISLSSFMYGVHIPFNLRTVLSSLFIFYAIDVILKAFVVGIVNESKRGDTCKE